MTEKIKCNGWTNYETWCAALWLDNDGSSCTYREKAEEIIQSRIDGCDDIDECRVRALESIVDDIKNDLVVDKNSNLNGLQRDLLPVAIGEINIDEIAKSYVDEIQIATAGWNMPGYMPDSDPAIFVGDDAMLRAKSYIADEMRRDAENKDGGAAEWLIHCADELDRTNTYGEIGMTVAGYHYWTAKV